MKKHLLALLILALVSVSALAQDKVDSRQGGMLYGPDHAYLLSAPRGWVMDTESGKDSGIQAVFYPSGSSWANGAAVMYTNVLKKASPAQSLKDVIDGELAGFRKESPNPKAQDAKAVSLGKEKSAAVKYLTGDQHNNFEAIAYIYEEKVVVIVVLSATSKKDFDSSLAAFDELVRSYSFLTAEVKGPVQK